MSEEMIVRNCSPTLAGMKTGSMFSCTYENVQELRREIRELNRRLAVKGLRIIPLRITETHALIYVYRPNRLRNDLLSSEVASILEEHGYSCDGPDKCVADLIKRLRDGDDFPHEIGLFLGYPPEDVRGFIENKAKESKIVGHWKVYGDAEKAQKLFEKYKKCTNIYIRQLTNGNTLDRLTVAV